MSALMTSLIRAVHTRCDRPSIFHDPYGDRLIDPAERPAIVERLLLMLTPAQRQLVEGCADPAGALDLALRLNPTYGAVIVRSRHAEDRLLRAIDAGARQYVVIGAGLDTFSLRRPDLAARLDIFELDTAAALTNKQERLAAANLRIAANVHGVAVDLEHQSLADALRCAAYSPRTQTFATCLGVAPYLTDAAFDRLLRSLAACTPPPSEIVFDYLDREALAPDRSDAAIRQVAAERASSAEPWRSGVSPATLSARLGAAGWGLTEDLDSTALHQRYCAGRADELPVTRHMHLARAGRRPR